MLSKVIKTCFRSLGLTVERRDRLAEQIPANYLRSPFLPKVYRQTLERILYFDEMVRRSNGLDGDMVECGVSIGHGMLLFALLHEIRGIDRRFIGLDSFAGFPAPTREDAGTHAYEGYYSTAPEIVTRVLEDGRISEETRKRVKLVKGFFDKTLPEYEGRIALLHLDCDLYESYRIALESLFAKVVRGGTILFDEYEDPAFPGARRAVDEFFQGRPEEIRRHEYGKYYVIKEH